MNESTSAADFPTVPVPVPAAEGEGERGSAAHSAFSVELGRRIKRLRIELGLTLKDLESRGGISATHVSEIERGKASPTVGALGRIAHALGVRPSLLVPATGLPDLHVVRAADRDAHSLRRGSLQVAPLTGPTHGARLGAHRLTLAVDSAPALTHQHEGEECITVLAGTVEIRVADTAYVLGEGDSLHFRAHHVHSYANAGKTPAVIIAASRPRFMH